MICSFRLYFNLPKSIIFDSLIACLFTRFLLFNNMITWDFSLCFFSERHKKLFQRYLLSWLTYFLFFSWILFLIHQYFILHTMFFLNFLIFIFICMRWGRFLGNIIWLCKALIFVLLLFCWYFILSDLFFLLFLNLDLISWCFHHIFCWILFFWNNYCHCLR